MTVALVAFMIFYVGVCLVMVTNFRGIATWVHAGLRKGLEDPGRGPVGWFVAGNSTLGAFPLWVFRTFFGLIGVLGLLAAIFWM